MENQGRRLDIEQPQIGKMNPNSAGAVERIAQEQWASLKNEPLPQKNTEQMEKTGVFSAESPLFDVTGNGVETETEQLEAMDSLREQDLKAENTNSEMIGFTDRRQEKIEEGTIREIERITREAGDDMASLNAKVDDLSWSFLLNAYNRRQGDGLTGKVA